MKRSACRFCFQSVTLPASAGQTSRESHGACSHVSFPSDRFSNHGPEPRRSRLVQWQLQVGYRNRLTAERRLTIHSYHPGPYASAEAFYESPFAKWAAARFYAGCLLPLTKHVQLDPYYQHENSTGTRPNQQKNAAGLILRLYFPRDKK
jgi:hypothetical protein